MTDIVVPGSISNNYTSRKRVTRPRHVHTWRVLVPRSKYSIWTSPLGFSFPRPFVPSFLRSFGSSLRSDGSGPSSLRSCHSSPTHRFITPSPPSGKAASLSPGIIYTIIVNTLVRRMPVLKTPNGLNLISTVRAGTKTLLELLTMRRGPPPVCLVRSSFLSYVPFVTLKSFYK